MVSAVGPKQALQEPAQPVGECCPILVQYFAKRELFWKPEVWAQSSQGSAVTLSSLQTPLDMFSHL